MKGLTVLPTLTVPGVAAAHGEAGHSMLANLGHVLASPGHLWPLAVIVLVALVAAARRSLARFRRKAASKP